MDSGLPRQVHLVGLGIWSCVYERLGRKRGNYEGIGDVITPGRSTGLLVVLSTDGLVGSSTSERDLTNHKEIFLVYSNPVVLPRRYG